jgi:uncharacterized protein YyaL (SSP411 family)
MKTTSNRLGSQRSPYLRQHQNNPVHWQPWDDAAFAQARERDCPVFLSIGYSTCHWCHVMEHESFEDAAVAQALNENFVSIKVDREELPDIDQTYMRVVQSLTGHGGWPMSVFMTPAGHPFFGGTYFPKQHFLQVLSGIKRAWIDDRAELEKTGEQIVTALRERLIFNPTRDEGFAVREFLPTVVAALKSDFDATYGGFGSAPKFPPATQNRLLMRIQLESPAKEIEHMVTFTFDRMARGGMYDQLGGGFARYSTDARWLIPHFEKMLYDNALLLSAYCEAATLFHRLEFLNIAREIGDYLLENLQDRAGGFYTAEDADSEGHEGTFYVWRYKELQENLTAEEFKKFAEIYDLSEEGNFEQGTSVLSVREGIPWEVVQAKELRVIRKKLLQVRAKRERPLRDEKIIAGLNGLAIEGLALLSRVADDTRFLGAARAAAQFVMTKLWHGDRLARRFVDGEVAFDGVLEDYAYLTHGLIELYLADGSEQWLQHASVVQAAQDRLFWREEQGLYATSSKPFLGDSFEYHDGATPCPNGIAAQNLLRLGELFVNAGWHERAQRIFATNTEFLRRFPAAGASFGIAVLLSEGRLAHRVLVAGEDGSTIFEKKKDELVRRFAPFEIWSTVMHSEKSILPGVQGKSAVDRQTVEYLCRWGVCEAPEILERHAPRGS